MKNFKKITDYIPTYLFPNYYIPEDEDIQVGDELIIGEEIKNKFKEYKIKWINIIVIELPLGKLYPKYVSCRKKYTEHSLEYWIEIYNKEIVIKPEHNHAFNITKFLTYSNSLKYNLVNKYKELSYLDFMRNQGCMDIDIVECPSEELCSFLHN